MSNKKQMFYGGIQRTKHTNDQYKVLTRAFSLIELLVVITISNGQSGIGTLVRPGNIGAINF
jgi:hypothetical protein